MMKHYSTVLFDIDDTLIDFKGSEALSLKECYDHFFSHRIAQDVFLNDYHRINQALWRQVEAGKISVVDLGAERFKQLMELHRIPFSSDVPHYYERKLVKNSQWIQGAEELLGNLLSQQIKIGFITNGFSHIQRGKYDALGLSRYSDVLVISEEVGVSKPHPHIFHHTLEKMQSLPSDTLMVGDSLTSDGEGARGMKISFCWYNPGRNPGPRDWTPDHVFHDLKDFSATRMH